MALFACLAVFGYTPYSTARGIILLVRKCVESGIFYPIDLINIPFLWNVGEINAVVVSVNLFYCYLFLLCGLCGVVLCIRKRQIKSVLVSFATILAGAALLLFGGTTRLVFINLLWQCLLCCRAAFFQNVFVLVQKKSIWKIVSICQKKRKKWGVAQ